MTGGGARAVTRTLTAADREAMRRTLGAAFLDDPVWVWLIGESRTTLQRCAAALDAFAMGHVGHGPSQITHDGNGVAIWTDPEKYRLRPKDLVAHLPATVRALGGGGMRRLLEMSPVEKLHPAEPHYYLALLGTHPHHQGTGLGSAAMAPVLATADEEGIGCYLESSKESNVAFYRRHRFDVIGTHDIAGGRGPRLWRMWREPRPPQD